MFACQDLIEYFFEKTGILFSLDKKERADKR